MTQKDKVKELVGRGLDSYHTKALQQMDRIEKKNKEQNHKISILSNELDNDYLTKTEEGSVISLDHSKEGMVYIDSLEGNTLVNYCTDGSKEMTLNGDIDVEGTFVTTTEGVDNGKVDVSCEGNTLVNIANDKTVSGTRRNGNIIITPTKLYSQFSVTHSELMSKLNTTYTIRIEVLSNTSTVPLAANKYNGTFNGWNGIEVGFTGEKIFTYTTGSEYQFNRWFWVENNVVGEGEIEIRLTILEGDWTDKEIPPYFEGMKSVGQDDENGHKIEILSRNKNLIRKEYFPSLILNGNYDGMTFTTLEDGSVIAKGTPIKSITQFCNFNYATILKHGVRYNAKDIGIQITKFDGTKQYGGFIFDKNTMQKVEVYFQWNKVGEVYDEHRYPMFAEDTVYTSDYIQGKINKKEILLNEPLRGLPNGVKDRFVKIGGKWFIERNRGIREYQEGDLDLTDVITDMTNTEYSLEVPIYEPLEINPELICYNDTTHISNNSTIPCNMKIKNSGYNAIIKPSTLYTVALDTNKSGTIGMNLGGVKGTTTNNILTLTTPATLTDDSLRLYGKGIKGSKVRLLEGDKTNWIPSFFEGMKSSFEDKLQDDNTYKIEILSNNKNLFNGTWVYDERNNKINSSDLIKVKPNTTYTISDNLNYRYQIYEYSDKSTHFNSMYPYAGSYTFTTNKRTHYLRFSTYAPSTDVDVKFILEEGRNITLYEPNKSNKIQFSSIEPLRSVGNTKDKFVFKNNKLMIERNIGEITIKDTILSTSKSSDTNRTYTTRFVLDKKLFPNIKLQTGNAFKSDRFKHTSWSLDVEGFGIGSNLDFNILNIRLSSLDVKGLAEWFKNNPTKFAYILTEPTYEEVPFELQKIILEGYENGTLFIDTNIPPTSTVTYAGETPIVKSVKLNKTEVLNNTTDINDNIIPYLMDMDYRVVCLELATETQGISMARLFGGVYEMLKRDILSGRLSKEEYGHRLADYFNAGKLTEQQVKELEDLR